MVQLEKNQADCLWFESNKFKVNKCKNCGMLWNCHKDIISDKDLERLRPKPEPVVVEKPKEQEPSKNMRKESVEEDYWFNDAPDNMSESGADNEGFGFQDLTNKASMTRPSIDASVASRPSVIRNLIDFDECNTLEPNDQPSPVSANAPLPATSTCCSSGGDPNQGLMLPEVGSCPGDPNQGMIHPEMGSYAGDPNQGMIHPEMGSYAGVSPKVGRPMMNTTTSWRMPMGNAPMHSKDDVLFEEIGYLRQMLADANEERLIQVAIIRDEVAEKQQTINDLTRQLAEAEALLRESKKECEQLKQQGTKNNATNTDQWQDIKSLRRMLDQRKADCDSKEDELRKCQDEMCIAQSKSKELQAEKEDLMEKCQNLSECCNRLQTLVEEQEHTVEELRGQAADRDLELQHSRRRLAVLDDPQKAAEAMTTEDELITWENEVKDMMHRTLREIAERRISVRVAKFTAEDASLCKICFERPISCALLPCKHHAFCMPCAAKIKCSQDPACPCCRTKVSGLFETFAG